MRRGYRIAYTMAMDNRNRSDIIDQLVELALERHARRRRNTKH